MYDAVIVGSGPNGLAAAITLAQAGQSVVVIEGAETVGGGMRSAELTLPGFTHDICSAIHPLGMGSPFFHSLPLADYGLEWIQPDIPLAHPFDDGSAAALHRSLDATAATVGADGAAYVRLMAPFVRDYDKIVHAFLGPLRLPRYPLAMARFGLKALFSAEKLARRYFMHERAQALFAGLAAHSIMPLDKAATAAFGLMLGILGHAVGWPLPRGGSQNLANALAAYLHSLGGEIVTGQWIADLGDLPPARATFLDITPRQFLHMAGNRLPGGYERRLQRYRYGPGVFKVDWALSEPIPWRAVAPRRAGTVHLGPLLGDMVNSERAMWHGPPSATPYIIVVQQTLFDATRSPAGKHTGWAYCHVPNGSTEDMTQAIEQQMERFAPGFGDIVLARHTMTTQAYERYNPNYVGGDINGGIQDLRQLFTRPVARINPYSTPLEHVYLCSSATPPGGGVHGMCGYFAARSLL
ncbi:MAG: NAD(P)/FAD-dependent oxidoreductase [Anaerolineae bacterium]|nr:NAD(P)/FAD-dependent oxidoreductase [Anaerolineae bacterium]